MAIRVTICPEDYARCAEYAETCMCAKKRGTTFNEGCINNSQDPYRAQRIGKLGETAFGRHFGYPVDYKYRRFGDRQDFIVGKKRVDVKTSSYSRASVVFLRVRHSSGSPILIRHDVYVLARLVHEDREAQQAVVDLCGYCTREDVERLPEVPARRGHHVNIEIPFKGLRKFREER
jgi:hypothetical protein